ncbi:hypothetical protein BJ742DRAFT_774987 [Cladochytrium replicatum]|nr:hypothetical protein BJ742DRAFT_774987 [Cladochytrium replicatum]
MAGAKITYVKQTLHYLVNGLTHINDRLTIVRFSDSAEIRLDAGSGTAMHTGIEKALEILKGRRTKNSVVGIFLLSDGKDNNPAFRYEDFERDFHELKCLTLTYGYGAGHHAETRASPVAVSSLGFRRAHDELDKFVRIRLTADGARPELSVANKYIMTMEFDGLLTAIHDGDIAALIQSFGTERAVIR